MMRRKKRIVKAVHEHDLEDFLASAGLLENAKAGKLVCASCGQSIHLKQISRFIIHKESVKVVCDRPTCCGLEDLSNAGN